MKTFRNILWGFVFIAIGILIALNSLGYLDINIFFSGWWTLFIIIPSFINLFKREGRIWSFVWCVVGIVLLLSAQGIVNFSTIAKLILPFILIVIGLSFLFRDVVSKKVAEKWKTVSKSKAENQEYCATFSGITKRFSGEKFEGANVDAIFGSVKLDLTDSIIESDKLIKTTSVFGGVEILVPDNINVQIKSTPIFGGISNKMDNKYDENLKTIFIDSFCLFGGVNIR